MIDGPPAWAVAIVFAGLLAVSWGEGDPGRGLAVFALGMLVALAAGTGLEGARLPPRGDGAPPLRFTGAPRPPPAERPRRVP